MKKLITLLSIPLIALTLNSCRDSSHNFSKYKVKGDLFVRVWKDEMGNTIKIERKDLLNILDAPHILARDNYPFLKDSVGDDRIDKIDLEYTPRGHPLEKYANLDSLAKLYNEVKETGSDFNDYKKGEGK